MGIHCTRMSGHVTISGYIEVDHHPGLLGHKTILKRGLVPFMLGHHYARIFTFNTTSSLVDLGA